MKRRDLLRAAGAATVLDLDALAGDGADDLDPAADTDRVRSVLARLPPLSATPGDTYDVTVARRVDDEYLLAPELLGAGDTYATLTAPAATVSVGVDPSGVDPPSGDAEAVAVRQGYEPAGTVAERPVYVRRTRRRASVVVPGSQSVVVGTGRDRRSVESFARAVARSDRESLAEATPAVGAALDRLGSGTLVSVTPGPALGESSVSGDDGRDPGPLVTASRIRVRGPTAAVRGVEVYPTAAGAARRANESTLTGAGPGSVAREGRALLVDYTGATAALGLEP